MPEYCDLVMKGGITSGVVYPKLIARLASKYEFKNIGGTSAGAIAASACAAAQYGARNGKPQAFGDLSGLPELLSEKVTPEGRSKLFTLFQPAAALRQHFSVLIRALDAQPRAAVWAVLWGLIGMYKGLIGIGLLLGSFLLWPSISALGYGITRYQLITGSLGMTLLAACVALLGVRSAVHGKAWQAALWVATLPALLALVLKVITSQGIVWKLAGSAIGASIVALLCLALLFALIVSLFVRGLLSGMHSNNYGICSGRTPDDATAPNQEGVTSWLATYINTLAGLPKDGPPLTFAHLWGHNDPEQPRQINLEVMTTAISQQMAYGIPFRPETRPFYYDPDEWAQLFPKSVMDYLNHTGQGSDGPDASTESAGLQVTSPSGKTLRQLARHGDLPVVVATRMSLSFPILLSAVPLYAIDWSTAESSECKKAGAPIVAKRVWFSDGGIGSNMPLHMFDALLPGHPTFAVNLKPEHPDHAITRPETPDNLGGRVYLPTNNQGGRQRYWPTPDDQTPINGLVGFFRGIVDTMQNWHDEIMFPSPGFRDRIIQISQRPDEGGLNLDMPADRIGALGHAGEMAADRLIDSFHPDGAENGRGWQQHMEIRLATFLGTMQPSSTALEPSLQQGVWHAIVNQLSDYRVAEKSLAKDFLTGVQQLGAMGPVAQSSLDARAPKPLPQVKIVPRI